MKNLLSCIAGSLAGFLFSAGVSATPLTYVETTDLTDSPFAGDYIGTLGEGVNTISGSVNGFTGDLADVWAADLAIGTVITDVIVEVSGFFGGQGAAIFGNGTGDDFLRTLSADGVYVINAPVGSDFISDFAITDNTGGFTSFDYKWLITVDTDTGVGVPAPAAWLLLIVGLGLVGLGKNRR